MSKKEKDSFFIGWGDTPRADRRFLLMASLGMVSLAAAGGALLASEQMAPGDGKWNPDDERSWRGYFVREPYPVLRMMSADGRGQTAYLVSSNKHGTQHRIGNFPQGPAEVRGSLISRGRNAMIAVADGEGWIKPATLAGLEPLAEWYAEDVGPATYAGEILDSKCWFGAMQPGQGKPHKSCAALCIRGGLPAVFCPDGLCGSGETLPLLTDENGYAHGSQLLPLVADQVIASGTLVRVRDVTHFRVALKDIRRV